MKWYIYFTMAVLAASLMSMNASADPYRPGDGITLIWVKIQARSGESRWQACRRVYQRDVYHVRRGQGNIMWCHIEHHRLYDYGERRQNYNLRRQ